MPPTAAMAEMVVPPRTKAVLLATAVTVVQRAHTATAVMAATAAAAELAQPEPHSASTAGMRRAAATAVRAALVEPFLEMAVTAATAARAELVDRARQATRAAQV